MERFAVMVRSEEGMRLVDDSGGCRRETRWLTSTWTIEDSEAAADAEVRRLNAGSRRPVAFVVPESDRYLYVGLN